MTQELTKVLVANRGEIAVRILRALRELDIRSVVVFSEADRDSLPVRLADEAYCIGPPPSSESYLRAEAIADLAVAVGADGLHPGYGFLSERAEFAKMCEDRGINFIGPPSSAIASMGSKVESRRLMREAGVPVVPGGTQALPDAAAAMEAAEEIGFPVMLKASAGGGGKGMRLVREPNELEAAFRAATSEAESSFGDSAVYVERFIERPRHVEIQILGDHEGHVVSLGERECSLQRRHQKVVEEAPSIAVDADLRRRMGNAAVRAAKAVGYTNAGTVEFLLSDNGDFYFLEMNTRLQVEHPVTEFVTGVDLVHAQLQVAQGHPLPPFLEGMQPRGHAIEVRLYAEDPYRSFAPSPGTIEHLRLPEGPGVRNDCGVVEGSTVSIHYDPMLSKLIVWGTDRGHAMKRLKRALSELRIDGIKTTAPLFRDLLENDDFLTGNFDIAWLDRKLEEGVLARAAEGDRAIEDRDLAMIAAALIERRSGRRSGSTSEDVSVPAGHRRNWGLAGRQATLRRSTWN